MSIILATEHLTRRFNTVVAVDDLTLSVEAGEVFGRGLASEHGRRRIVHEDRGDVGAVGVGVHVAVGGAEGAHSPISVCSAHTAPVHPAMRR